MKKIIPLARPDIQQRDIQKVIDVLQSGMLVQGKSVLELEYKVRKFCNTQYCSAVSNGTASLHLALISLGIGRGDEVIVPAFSYIASANVVELVGGKPVFIDIDLQSFTLDVTKIEKSITSRTKAIMPVHEFGLCADMDPIIELAAKYDLFIIEDAACALGATYKGKKAGSMGDFGSFSLHPRKAITSGEGGLLTCNEKNLDAKIKTLRNHGVNYEDPTEFIEAGFNYRLTDIQGALASSQMDRFPETLMYKDRLASVYLEELNKDRIKLPVVFKDRSHTWQTFHVLLESHEIRTELIRQLSDNQVFTNYGAQCIPAMKYYANKYKYDAEHTYPNAFRAFRTGLALPLYELLTENDIKDIAKIINQFLK